ncbi:hypothetical protein Tco_1518072 [Tanacetum coccineum]
MMMKTMRLMKALHCDQTRVVYKEKVRSDSAAFLGQQTPTKDNTKSTRKPMGDDDIGSSSIGSAENGERRSLCKRHGEPGSGSEYDIENKDFITSIEKDYNQKGSIEVLESFVGGRERDIDYNAINEQRDDIVRYRKKEMKMAIPSSLRSLRARKFYQRTGKTKEDHHLWKATRMVLDLIWSDMAREEIQANMGSHGNLRFLRSVSHTEVTNGYLGTELEKVKEEKRGIQEFLSRHIFQQGSRLDLQCNQEDCFYFGDASPKIVDDAQIEDKDELHDEDDATEESHDGSSLKENYNCSDNKYANSYSDKGFLSAIYEGKTHTRSSNNVFFVCYLSPGRTKKSFLKLLEIQHGHRAIWYKVGMTATRKMKWDCHQKQSKTCLLPGQISEKKGKTMIEVLHMWLRIEAIRKIPGFDAFQDGIYGLPNGCKKCLPVWSD